MELQIPFPPPKSSNLTGLHHPLRLCLFSKTKYLHNLTDIQQHNIEITIVILPLSFIQKTVILLRHPEKTVLFTLLNMLVCFSFWPGSHYSALHGPKLVALLLLLPKCWGYRSTLPMVITVLFSKDLQRGYCIQHNVTKEALDQAPRNISPALLLGLIFLSDPPAPRPRTEFQQLHHPKV